ncbi:MAG TPA: hypothetical protein VF246_06960 [Acidimicrobiia bacterium]
MRRSLIPILLLILAACSSGGQATTTTDVSTTSTTAATTTTTAPVTTTTVAATTTTLSPDGLVLPLATDTMPDTWREVFFIPYGDTPDTLGTSLGGDGGGVFWGPEYGAQAPDGSWWFLDTAKFRLAHFDSEGRYIEQVVIPTEMLVDGMYFQWSNPRVLDDGTVLASRYPGDTYFLRYRDGELDEFSVPVAAVPRIDDGDFLYALSFEDSSLWMIDPVAETAERTEAMRAKDGRRFTAAVSPSTIHLELIDVALSQDLVFTSGGIAGGAYLSIEVATDHEGSLHLFILGFPEADESQQLAGYMKLSAEGQVLLLEGMMDPSSASDPGTPARLGVTPGTTNPTFMVIGTDGVRVYTRD